MIATLAKEFARIDKRILSVGAGTAAAWMPVVRLEGALALGLEAVLCLVLVLTRSRLHERRMDRWEAGIAARVIHEDAA